MRPSVFPDLLSPSITQHWLLEQWGLKRTVTNFPRLILEYSDQIPVQTKFQDCRLFDHFCRVRDLRELLLLFEDRLSSLLFLGPGTEYTRREEAAAPRRKMTS